MDSVIPCQECKVSSPLPTSPPLDLITLPSTFATSNVQTDVESPQLDASVSSTFPRPMGVPVPVLFSFGSECLATALKSEGFVVLHISEPIGRPTRSSVDFPPCWLRRAVSREDLQHHSGVGRLGVRVLPASCFYNWQKEAKSPFGVPDLCCAPREYLRVHDENVGMKIAAQRLENCAWKDFPTLL